MLPEQPARRWNQSCDQMVPSYQNTFWCVYLAYSCPWAALAQCRKTGLLTYCQNPGLFVHHLSPFFPPDCFVVLWRKTAFLNGGLPPQLLQHFTWCLHLKSHFYKCKNAQIQVQGCSEVSLLFCLLFCLLLKMTGMSRIVRQSLQFYTVSTAVIRLISGESHFCGNRFLQKLKKGSCFSSFPIFT